MTQESSIEKQELRDFAKKSIKRKRDAWQFLAVTVAVNIMLTAVWWLTSPTSYYWPIWVIFGMGVGVLFSFIDAYFKPVNRPITDADIELELEKLRSRRR